MILENSPIIAQSKVRRIRNQTTMKELSDTQKEAQRHQKFREAKHASMEPIVKNNMIFNGELLQNKQALDDSNF